MRSTRKQNGMFDFFTKPQVTYHGHIVRDKKPSLKPLAKFKGVQVWKTPDGEYTTAIDKDSRHDTLGDAHRFIASWKKNPHRKRNAPTAADLIPGGGSILDTLDRTGQAWSQVGKHVAKGVKHAVSHLTKRKNPNGSAQEKFREFTGYEPDKVFTLIPKQFIHDDTYALGVLLALIVADTNGKFLSPLIGSGVKYLGNLKEIYPGFQQDDAKGVWEFNENLPPQQINWLTGSVGTKLKNKKIVQMFIQGGDQHLDTNKLGLQDRDHHDHMLIGTLQRVWYLGKKKFEGPDVVSFYHDFGNEGSRGVCPLVVYKPLNPSIEIVGGRYEVALPERSLGNISPGIVG